MYNFIRLIGYIFVFLEWLKGNKTVIVNSFPNDNDHYLEATFNGFSLQIFCSKQQYRRKYDRWYIPNQDRSNYHVYCKIVEEENGEVKAPDDLKLACELKTNIPSMLPEFVELKYHRIAITHAYLDILIHRLERIKAGLPP